jgi:serine/threonine protein kinase
MAPSPKPLRAGKRPRQPSTDIPGNLSVPGIDDTLDTLATTRSSKAVKAKSDYKSDYKSVQNESLNSELLLLVGKKETAAPSDEASNPNSKKRKVAPLGRPGGRLCFDEEASKGVTLELTDAAVEDAAEITATNSSAMDAAMVDVDMELYQVHAALVDNMLVERDDIIFEIFSYFITPNLSLTAKLDKDAKENAASDKPRATATATSSTTTTVSSLTTPSTGSAPTTSSIIAAEPAAASLGADIQNIFLVSKLWYKKVSDTRLWRPVYDLLGAAKVANRAKLMGGPDASLPSNVNMSSLAFLTGMSPTKIGYAGDQVEKKSITTLAPFINMGQKHIGSEGVLFKIKERTTGKVYAMKKTKGKEFNTLSGGTSNTGLSLHYPALRELTVLQSHAVKSCANVSGVLDVMIIDGDMYRWYNYISVSMSDDLSLARTKNIRPYDDKMCKDLMRQLLEGLRCLHSHGIIHRNLKPKHLLLDYRGKGASRTVNLKISDFALTRACCEPRAEFTPDQVTIWYRPPEILLGGKEYDTSVDIWSAGCIFIEMFTGAAMFRDKSEIGLLFKIFKVIGTPNDDSWKGWKDLPNNCGAENCVIFPEWEHNMIRGAFYDNEDANKDNLGISHYDLTSTCAYLEKSGGFDFMERLLVANPRERLTASSALEDGYFSDKVKRTKATKSKKKGSGKASKTDAHALWEERRAKRDETYYRTLQESAELLPPPLHANKTSENSKKPCIKASHRAILVDWLVEIVDVFDMSPRTTFVAMSFLDAYIARGLNIQTDKLQLFGATCLHIASKIEDGVRYISTKDLTFCGDNTYKIHDIVDMERKILSSIDFEISLPTVFDFALSQYTNLSKKWGECNKLKHAIGFICEVALQGTTHLVYDACTVATSILCLARIVCHEKNPFPDEMKELTQKNFKDLRACMDKLWHEAKKLQSHAALKVIVRRFKKEERSFVGGIALNTMTWTFEDLLDTVKAESKIELDQ